MKTLTLTQPWANLVAIGAKRIETRSWGTSYRGSLAIHAAKGFPKWAREFTTEAVCYEAMRKLGHCTERWFPAYPIGAIVATVNLIDCVRMSAVPELYQRPSRRLPVEIGKWTELLMERENEVEFGDYSPGRYAWILSGVKAVEQPIEAKGALGLWEYAGYLSI